MLKVNNVNVYGLENAVICSRYPMVTDVEKFRECLSGEDYLKAEKVACNLSNTGGGEAHDQWLTGITVTFDVTASLQWWPEAQRYKFLNFISSTSKMHKLSKMEISSCCNEYVSRTAIYNAELWQEQFQKAQIRHKEGLITKEELNEAFYSMIYNIPLGFELTAGMITNYRCLRNIYRQRRKHRLQEWQVFCNWIETLPEADKYITVGLKKDE